MWNSQPKKILGWETESKIRHIVRWDSLAPEFDSTLTSAYNCGDESVVVTMFDNFYFANFKEMTWTDSFTGVAVSLRPVFGMFWFLRKCVVSCMFKFCDPMSVKSPLLSPHLSSRFLCILFVVIT